MDLEIKFLLFLSVPALTLLLMTRRNAVFFNSYVLFYPIVLALWRLPMLLVRLGSWSLALGIANAIVSIFNDLRYKIISLFVFAVAFTVIYFSPIPSILAISVTSLLL